MFIEFLYILENQQNIYDNFDGTILLYTTSLFEHYFIGNNSVSRLLKDIKVSIRTINMFAATNSNRNDRFVLLSVIDFFSFHLVLNLFQKSIDQ